MGGNLISPGFAKYSGSVFSRPNPGVLQNGDAVYFDDYPPFFGSYWRYSQSIQGYAPFCGDIPLCTLPTTSSDTDGTATEQPLFAAFLPAGLSCDFSVFLFDIFMSVTAGGANTIRLRCGTADDASGTLLLTNSAGGANRNTWIMPSLRRISATDLQVFSGHPLGNTADAQPTVVTVDDMTENDLWFVITAQVANPGEIASLTRAILRYSLA